MILVRGDSQYVTTKFYQGRIHMDMSLKLYILHIYLYLKNLINKINNLDKYLLSFG